MNRLTLSSDSFNEMEIEAAIGVLRSGQYTMGEKVKEYESQLAKWLGVNHVVMVNSGSSANLLLIESFLRRSRPVKPVLSPGDEVLVPALAWPTTVWPVLQLGLIPVFVDSDPDTLAIDLASAEKALGPKTKAIFMIHVLGQAANMNAYREFCRSHNLILAEDCCESLGAFFDGQHVGSFGVGGTLSHFFSHHLTTMEGGAVITNDLELADDFRSFRAHGWIRDRSDRGHWIEKNPELDPRFLFATTGYNVRPLEIEAAIGLVQLKKLDGFIKRRFETARAIQNIVKQVSWLEVIGAKTLEYAPERREANRHTWMYMPLRLTSDCPLSLERVKETFETCGVDTRAIIAGNLTRHPVMQRLPHRIGSDLSVANEALNRGLMIGCHPDVTADGLQCLDTAIKTLQRML